jgi:hypothetical protein
MRHLNYLAPVILFGLIVSLAADAAQPSKVGPDYYCDIELALDAESPDSPDLEGYPVGEKFVVERRTGVMKGGLRNSYMTEPQVIDYGSADNSYKVVTTMKFDEGLGASTNLHSLVIQEWASGFKKPFVYLWDTKVYFGTCIHN